MTKVFYDHLVVREEIIAEIDKHVLAIEEREELVQLVDENLHHQVLDIILSSLPREKHEEFLIRFHNTPHDENLLDYLKRHDTEIEKKITEEAKKIKSELLAEIKRAKKSPGKN